ncbi:Signal transducer regulating beta-lactamase production, contains metallopeptidase domain [Flavobacterium segetis]|uniref:Signal transducer regulating beta-lactamase production, contains metallopeptidase domain n=1 Tax=Flavobacterium segetis TaxID=271157 RepID=A0A1M5IV43_9FLAO|nr:M56 family metallopeptidase [Flavobacterium segetis]SHG32212.1 Signal transducer regulating beta-lactamase production, contains metallopeptidase domain [Flavobacterium segetis]
MEALFIYLIKSSGLIVLFFLAYHFLLRKETFFTGNRWFLQLGLFTAILLPLLVFTKTVLVEASANTIDWSEIPIATSANNKDLEMNWYLLLLLVYGLGAFLLLAKFLCDFYSLNAILKNKTLQNQTDYKLIDTTENLAPFSYFKIIVYNSSLYNQQELNNILEHEKIHCDQNHTLDVLISRVFCILFWFNPVVWFYKKAIVQNLEFIADQEATTKIEDKKSYQITLLKITTQEHCVAITNHFYQSLIKKRIVMLNKTQSKKRNSWKYAFVIPALVAFVMLFQIEVIAQEKITNENAIASIDKVVLDVNASSTEKALNDEREFFKQEFDIDMYFSQIKVNSHNEIIAIKVTLKNNEGVKKVYSVKEEGPIKPFAVFVVKEKSGNFNFGFQSNTKENIHLSQHINHINMIQNGSEKEQPLDEIIADTQPNNSWSLNGMSKDGKEYLIVLNGTKQVKGTPIKISFNEVFDTRNILDPKEAMLKYGEEGKNGAHEITTKKSTTSNKAEKNIEINQTNALLIIDGKKADPKLKVDDIDPDTIASVNVIKGKSATDKYGNDAVNGVLEITLKKVLKTLKKDNSKLNTIPEDAEIYIDGKKSTKTELDKLSPNLIDSIDIIRSATNEKVMKVTTKKKQ